MSELEQCDKAKALIDTFRQAHPELQYSADTFELAAVQLCLSTCTHQFCLAASDPQAFRARLVDLFRKTVSSEKTDQQ